MIKRYYGVLTKRLAGNYTLSQQYMNHGRKLLGYLKNQYDVGKLGVIERAIQLKDGTVIRGSIRHGRFAVMIDTTLRVAEAIAVTIKGLLCVPKSDALPRGFPESGYPLGNIAYSDDRQVILVPDEDTHQFVPYYFAHDDLDYKNYRSVFPQGGIRYGINDWRGKSGLILSWWGIPGRSIPPTSVPGRIAYTVYDQPYWDPVYSPLYKKSANRYFSWNQEAECSIFSSGKTYSISPYIKYSWPPFIRVHGAAAFTIQENGTYTPKYLVMVGWHIITPSNQNNWAFAGEFGTRLFYRRITDGMGTETSAANRAAWKTLHIFDTGVWAAVPNFLFNSMGTEGMAVVSGVGPNSIAPYYLIKITLTENTQDETLTAVVTQTPSEPLALYVATDVSEEHEEISGSVDEWDTEGIPVSGSRTYSSSSHKSGQATPYGKSLIVAADYDQDTDAPVFAILKYETYETDRLNTQENSKSNSRTGAYGDGWFFDFQADETRHEQTDGSIRQIATLNVRGVLLTLADVTCTSEYTYDYALEDSRTYKWERASPPGWTIYTREYAIHAEWTNSVTESFYNTLISHLDLRLPFILYVQTSRTQAFAGSRSSQSEGTVDEGTSEETAEYAASMNAQIEFCVHDQGSNHVIGTVSRSGQIITNPFLEGPPGSTIKELAGFFPYYEASYPYLSDPRTEHTGDVLNHWMTLDPIPLVPQGENTTTAADLYVYPWVGSGFTTASFDGNTVLATWDILSTALTEEDREKYFNIPDTFKPQIWYPSVAQPLGLMFGFLDNAQFTYTYMTDENPYSVLNLPGDKRCVVPVGII